MSSYLNKYIEVKKNGKWYLVKWNAIDENGNINQKSELSHGLVLRDTVNWKQPGWEGLPTDVSDEVKEITESLNERLKSFGWSSGYHFKYATLTEFEEILKKETEDFVKGVQEAIKKQEDNKILDGINELKALVKGKTYKKKKKSEDEEDLDFYDSVEYKLDTEGYDSCTLGYLLGLTEAIGELKTLAYLYLDDEYSWKYTGDDIRIIFYFD